MFGNWSISTGDLLPSKIMNFKEMHTFYKKLPLLLNLTQFYIPSQNTNLKMDLYEKLHFLKNRDPCPTKGTMTKQGAKEQQNERSENWICFILAIRITLRLWTIFSWTWISLQISLQKNSKMSNQKTECVLSLSLGILDCNTEMGNEITFYPANSWVLLNQLRIVTFGNILVIMNIGLQHKDESTFEL